MTEESSQQIQRHMLASDQIQGQLLASDQTQKQLASDQTQKQVASDQTHMASSDALKSRQRHVRRNITLTCRHIEEMVARRQSRRGIKHLSARVDLLMGEAEQLNNQLSSGLTDQAEFDHQVERHLYYIELVSTTAEAVEGYLTDRLDDAPSIHSSQQDPAAQQRELERQQQLEAAQQQVAESRAAAEIAEQALRDLQGPVGHDDHQSISSRLSVSSSQRVHDWLDKERRNAPVNPSLCVEAPGQWIDIYLSGQEKPLLRSNHGQHSSLKTELGVYSGKALEWFCWIDLFHALVHQTSKLPGEKLAILKNSLKGDCANLVYGLGGGEPAYKEALKRLKDDYGRRDVMRAAHLQALEKLETPKGDPVAFKRYAERVRTHLFDLTRIGETGHADIIERVCQKLKLADRLAWNEGRGTGLERRSLNQFGNWICARAAAYQNAHSIAAEQLDPPAGKQNSSPDGTTKRQVRAHQSSTKTNVRSKTKRSPYCLCCKAEHWLESCPQFKLLPVKERETFCVQRRLCFSCLCPGHSSRDCRRRKECSSAGCILKHHELLHDGTTSGATASSYSSRSESRRVALGVIQLDALNKDGVLVPVNVMLDEGSDSTLVREGFVRRLGLQGVDQVLAVDGTGGVRTHVSTSHRVVLKLQTSSGERIEICGSTMPMVTKPVPLTDWAKLQARWKHLAGLPLRVSGGQVDILLGLDHAQLSAVIETRIGEENEPVAIRTRLGWIVRGVVGVDVKPTTARVYSAFTTIEDGESRSNLADAMRRFYETESFGTEHQADCLSPDDRRALMLLDAGTKKLSVGYETPVLWREGEPQLSDNRLLAESRNRSLVNHFNKDPEFERKYRAAMQKNFDEGYAIRLTQSELADESPAYYLPHFGVYKSSSGKDIRIVYDAAAKYRGRCLNDCICSGPALQNPLPSVVIKFREGEITWAADIKAMFSRIRLNQADMRFHRFLWPEKDGQLSVCAMTRVTFGVSCSPFVAIRTTWRAAEDAGPEMSEAAASIKTNIYVDDYLGSAKTVQGGIKIAADVKRVLADGDFHLQGWTSNSPEFLAAIQPPMTPPVDGEESHALGADDTETVLGIVWHPQRDTLGFKVTGLNEVSYTRVGLASKVASLFDPQGTAAPMTVKGKIRLRELGTKGLDWSDQVVGEDKRWWEQWFNTLGQLKHVEIPRCLFPDEDNIDRIELHTFCDSSEEAYAAVVYVRSVYKDDRVLIRHVKAATKLAPKKTLSIPKLELNAALLGARLARFVQDISPGESKTVSSGQIAVRCGIGFVPLPHFIKFSSAIESVKYKLSLRLTNGVLFRVNSTRLMQPHDLNLSVRPFLFSGWTDQTSCTSQATLGHRTCHGWQ